MNEPDSLLGKAEAVLGRAEPVLAAGIFGLQGGYLGLAVSGAAGSSVGSLAGGVVGGVVGNLAGRRAAREVRASSQGVSVRMLVAVTAAHIHILDWATGQGPTAVLRSFDRSSTSVDISKFGLSRRVALREGSDGPALVLTGTTVVFSAEAKGDKAVLTALA